MEVLPLATFRPYTRASYSRLCDREELLEKQSIERAKHAQDAHLVDGELVYGRDDDTQLPPENPDLGEGCLLTKAYGRFPPRFYGKPVEEIDPGIRHKTFIVIGRRFKKSYIYRFTAESALWVLPGWNPLRKMMMYIMVHQAFDLFIFLTIVTNCVFLAMPDEPISEKLEYLFLGIYTLECVVRVLARGFIWEKHTYLRDPWNWLDLTVILIAYVTLVLENLDPSNSLTNASGLRTFRVLRAMKTVSIVPGLKTIVSALLRACRMLLEVILLTSFCLMVFAIFGLQMYMEKLRHKCVKEVTGYKDNPSQSFDEYYAQWIRNSENWFENDDGENPVCGNTTGASGAGRCPDYYICLKDIGENPRWGYLNFDHFGWAIMSCFQLITLDFWEDIYSKVILATGPWNVIFFLVIIFLGSFYLINLMLAVVSMSYEEEAVNAGKEKEREKKENARNKHNANYDIAIGSPQLMDNSGDENLDKETDDDLNNSAVKGAAARGIGIDKSTFKRSQNEIPLPVSHSGDRGVDDINDDEFQDGGKYVIIKADTLVNPDIGAMKGQLIDRNFNGCGKLFCNFYVPFLVLQSYFYSFVSDPLFDLFITFCIIVNTALMSSEHFEQPVLLDTVLEILNNVFAAIFIIESICKLLGLGKYYFKNVWNIFDLGIVIMSIVDMMAASETDAQFTVFRTFRLLRVFKLAQSWPTMRMLLSIIVSAFGALANLCVILAIVIYIFAVIGLQMFREHYNKGNFKPDDIPRWNFTTFYKSMLMIFRVLCGEWIEPSWDCMRAYNELCLIVFLPALVFGNFVVLNLFLALLLNAFSSDTGDQKDSSEERSKLIRGVERLREIFCCCCSKINVPEEDEYENCKIDVDTLDKSTVDRPSSSRTFLDDYDNTSETSEEPDLGPQNCLPECITKRMTCCDAMNDTSFGQGWAKLRLFMYRVVTNKVFEGFILLIILCSSLTLAFEDVYLYQKKDWEHVLDICNYVFTTLFTIEMCLKIVGLGLVDYFTHFWTILDFIIVCISIASIVLSNVGKGGNLQSFRAMRTLRALRPLRAISRWQGMKIVVNALMNAIPAIVNVLMVCMVFWLIFSILGVQLFKGKFYKCIDLETEERVSYDNISNKAQCEQAGPGYKWKNANVNFDNVLIGFLALFQVATFEGWMEIMSDAADAPNAAYEQPKHEHPSDTTIVYLYFVVFIVIGAFFSLNLFIGVIIDNFNVLKKKYEGSYLDAFLTQKQRNYYNTLKRLGKKLPQKTIRRPNNKCQLYFYNMATSNKFELSIVVLIFFNMIVIASQHYQQTPAVEESLEMLNIIFTSAFALEAVIKIIGLRVHYFRFWQNLLDFIIVVLSLLDIVKKNTDRKLGDSSVGAFLADFVEDLPITPTLLRIVRVCRIGKVLRLIKAAKGIRKLLFALIISLPAIFNIGALLFLIMYIYAIIGMTSFGNIMLTGILDEVVNFETFGHSFMLLLRLATSAGWNDVLDALLVEPPTCNNTHYERPSGEWVMEKPGNCGTPWLAISFMVSYIVIVWLIVINMYIAVILENFSQAHEQEELGITEDDFDMYYIVWEKYDPNATQFINYEQLADFVGDLEPPLKIAKPNEIALVSFNLPIMEDEKMHCLDILLALVRNVLGSVEDTEEMITLKQQMEEKFAHTFPARVNITVRSSTLQRKKEDVAARTLQRAWKSYKAQKAMRNITALAVKQRLRRASAIGLRSRTDTMKNLGIKLTNALNKLFAKRKHRPVPQFSHTHLQTLNLPYITGKSQPESRNAI